MIKTLARNYFTSLYARTMREAYGFARRAIIETPGATTFLDCGCHEGSELDRLRAGLPMARPARLTGIEWNARAAEAARRKGHVVVQGDLNKPFDLASGSQDCVFALSVLEHLLMPCAFMLECRRVLRPGGRLVLLTPNISTYFTALLILAGRMPSSGPHPDSLALIRRQEAFAGPEAKHTDPSEDHPVHRHLVVFSYRALRDFLRLSGGFRIDAAKAYGLYPLPNLLQPLAERIDPWHCHQMVFVCSRLPD